MGPEGGIRRGRYKVKEGREAKEGTEHEGRSKEIKE